MRLRILVLSCLCVWLPAQDGPYVQWEGRRARVLTEEAGQLKAREEKAPFQLPLPPPMEGRLLMTGKPLPPDPAVFPAPSKILAVSDVHGHLDDLLALLRAHGAVDAAGRWTYGRGHLVIAGDALDRGDQVTQALWFIRKLEHEAARAGGRVHMLLGNHEAMVASGDLRYTSPRYVAAPIGLPTPQEALSPAGEFGRWLRTKPALLKLGPFLFTHGGVSPALVARGDSLATVNATLRAHFGERGGGTDEASFLLGPEGPLWFRGYFAGEAGEVSDAQLDAILARFKVKAIVVGHTTEERVEALQGGRVYAIDAGLKEGRGEVWMWEKGKAYRGLKDGSRVALE